MPTNPAVGRLPHLAALWLLLALCVVAIARVTPATPLSSPALPLLSRIGLIAGELVLLGFAVLLLGAALRGLASLRLPGARVTAAAVALAALAIYGLSWATYRSTGRFLETSGIALMAASPGQFFQHVAHIEPRLLWLLPLGLVGAALLMLRGLPYLIARQGASGRRATASLPIALALACAALAALGSRSLPADKAAAVDPHDGMAYELADLYALYRDERTGPLSFGWAALGRVGTLPPQLDPTISITHRPLLPVEEWKRRVEPARSKDWNVLLVIIESLRPDQLQSFGGERSVMPNLDAIAREGRRYRDHYAQASHSNYSDLCPLSSHYPLRSRTVHIYPDNPTYPRVLIYDLLSALGWRTAIVSSQNEGWGRMRSYLKTGSLDLFLDAESFDGPTYVPRHDEGFESYLKGSKRSGKIDDRFTVDEAIGWIGGHGEDEPWFIYLNLQNSHLPYETPSDFPRRFGPDHIGFTIRFSGYPREQTEVVKDLYADSLAYVDHQLGRLFAFLRERGDLDRTIVIVTGDTGQAFYEHGVVAHAGPIYEEVMRVPLVIRAPGLGPADDSRPAQHVDVPPTVLELLGLPPHPSFQGESLLGEVNPARSRYLVAQTSLAHQYAVVREGMKLVFDDRSRRVVLYDLDRDPGEMRDVWQRHPAVMRSLRGRLDTWRRAQLDYYSDPAAQLRSYPPVLRD